MPTSCGGWSHGVLQKQTDKNAKNMQKHADIQIYNKIFEVTPWSLEFFSKTLAQLQMPCLLLTAWCVWSRLSVYFHVDWKILAQLWLVAHIEMCDS